MFFGLGSDGTVGANKASVKIIGEHTGLHAQGYFVYDSKKSGSVTVSHLRFGPEPIRSTYLVEDADFVACHQFGLLGKAKVVEAARHGATLLLNAPYGPDEVWARIPPTVRRQLVEKQIDLWVIDAAAVAKDAGMGNRINTVMQPCFFQLAERPAARRGDRADQGLRRGRRTRSAATRSSRANFAAIDRSLAALRHVPLGEAPEDAMPAALAIPAGAPGLRGDGHRAADRRQRRPPAGERAAARRHVPHRHRAVREAGARADDPDLGPVDLHRLRQVRDRLPALDASG